MREQHRGFPGPIFGGLLALLALLASCEDGGGGPEPVGMRFERNAEDLGSLTSGVVVTVRFPFLVAGEPVRIDRLEPGCGCLEPRLELDGRRAPVGATLEAGSRGEIVVEYDTTGFQGQKDTLVRVLGSGGGLPAELAVRSRLEPWLVVEPDRFSSQTLEGDGPWAVDFRVTGREPFRLMEVLGLPAEATVEGLPSPGRALELSFQVELGPETAQGEHAWFLKLRADNGLSTVIPFQYRREMEVWTRPARVVRLGSQAANSEVFATVDLGTSRGTLTVREFHLEGLPGARVECLNLIPSKTYRVRMALPTGSEAGLLMGKLFLSLVHEVDGQRHNLDRQLTLAGVVE